MTPRRPWCIHSSSIGLTTATVCFMGCRVYIICVHYRMPSTPRREWCWRWRSFNILLHSSAISSTGCLWNNVSSSSRRYLCTRSSVRQLHRTLPTCVNPCQRVPRDAIFARQFTGILWSCDADNRTTRYGKRSFPASAPLTWNSLPTTFATFLSKRTVSVDVWKLNCFAELTELT